MIETTGRIHRVERFHPQAASEALLRPRSDVVEEHETARDGQARTVVFGATAGPFEHYRRTVRIEQVDDSTGSQSRAAGSMVVETTEFRLATPVWRPLLQLPTRRTLGRPPDARTGPPWWAPPTVVDARAARALSLLCVLAVITSYVGTLLSQTITFAAEEFAVPDGRQGITLASVRVGVILALGAAGLADRHGRRRALLLTVVLACFFTATTALVPSLIWFGVAQTAARGFATGAGILIGIVAAEELPAGSRAYGVSVLTLCAGLGSGMAVWFLPLADLGPMAWRILYLIAIVGVPAGLATARRIPETRRFGAPARHGPDPVDDPTVGDREPMPWGRLALLAAGSFLGLLFLAPASQFANEYLRDEHGFSAARLAAFTLLTSTPAGIGVAVGGRLADVHGRRPIGSVALAGGVALTVVTYLSGGAVLWIAAVAGSVVAGASAPALGVYGPELFPTRRRGQANGVITLVGVIGSSVGLLVTGFLSDRLGGLGPPIALLAIGPAILVALIVVCYPETAQVELEDLNPPRTQPRSR